MRVIKIGTKLGDVELLNTSLGGINEIVGEWDWGSTPRELFAKDISLVCGANGCIKQLAPNENLFPFFYVGECVLVHYDRWKYSSLTDADLIFLKQWLKRLDNGELYEVNI